MIITYLDNVTSLWLGDGLSRRKGCRGADAQNRLSRPLYRSPPPRPPARPPTIATAAPHPASGHRGNRGKNTREYSYRGRGIWRARASIFRMSLSGFEKDFGNFLIPSSPSSRVQYIIYISTYICYTFMTSARSPKRPSSELPKRYTNGARDRDHLDSRSFVLFRVNDN